MTPSLAVEMAAYFLLKVLSIFCASSGAIMVSPA